MFSTALLYLGERARSKMSGSLGTVEAEVLGALEVALLRIRRVIGLHVLKALLVVSTKRNKQPKPRKRKQVKQNQTSTQDCARERALANDACARTKSSTAMPTAEYDKSMSIAKDDHMSKSKLAHDHYVMSHLVVEAPAAAELAL